VKRFLLLATVAIVFGGGGAFFGHLLALSGQPVVVARNLTSHAIPQIKLETDVGELHVLTDLPSHQSRRVKISARDKSLWVVAKLDDGKELSSQKIYVTSQGFVFAMISEDRIELDYEL
jgi:hypothetical protein